MKRSLFLMGFMISVMTAQAQERLRVMDAHTLQPVVMMMVYRAPDVPLGLTDNRGELTISGVADGDTLVFRMLGFNEQRIRYADVKAAGFRVMLTEKSVEMGEVVISASRFEESSGDIPRQVEVITAKEMQFLSQPTTAEVLSQTGLVMVQKSQLGGGSPVLRGFEANKVQIVVDGVRMNNAIFRGGHLQNVISLDNSILDRTELVMGPGSVIYGSDALGGVMHFHTRKPVLADSGLLVKGNGYFRYGSAMDELTGHADVSVGGKKVGFLGSLTSSNFSDLRTGKQFNPAYGTWGQRNFYQARINDRDTMLPNSPGYIQTGTGYRQWDVMAKLYHRPHERLEQTLNIQYSTTSDIPRYDRLTELGTSGKFKWAEWYYGPQGRILGSWQMKWKAGNAVFDQMNITAAWQAFLESRHTRSFGNVNLQHRTETLQSVSLNADFSKQVKRNEFRYGLEGIWNQVTSTAMNQNVMTLKETALDTRYPNGGSTMDWLAAYLTHSIELSDKWILTEGVRFNRVGLHARFSDTTFFKFPYTSVSQNNLNANGSIGVVFHPAENWKLYSSVATGFRAPNVDDLAKVFESAPGRIIVPNANLRPENTINYEFGLSAVLADIVKLEGSAWYTDYRNIITVDRFTWEGKDSIRYNGTLSGVFASQNKRRAWIGGMNGFVSVQIAPFLSAEGSLTWTKGRIRTDTTDYPLDHIPPMFGRAAVNFQMNKLRVQAYVLFNGWKKLEDYNMVGEDNFIYATANGNPAWATLNLRVSFAVNPHMMVQAACENLLDQHYRVFSSGISAPGRNLMLTIRGSF